MEFYNEDYLMHHGVKGMKWGVRRYRNKDGSLTPAGKKKVSKAYKREADKVTEELNKRGSKMYVDAYNKAANKMNNGGIDKFNAEQKKKYGDNYSKRDGYQEDYMRMFDKQVNKNMNKSLSEFYKTNKNYQKAQSLVKQYNMTSWDKLAKENAKAIQSLRDALEED